MVPVWAMSFGWTSISQARFGMQVSDVQQLQNGTWAMPEPGLYQRQLGFLWTFPSETEDTRGLGGGIAWAWDNAGLCGSDGILRLFREDLFFANLVGCDDLHAAMHRAFSSWSDNHASINFLDVTSECTTLLGRPPADKDDCPLVEVWVTARRVEAQVSAEGTLEAASATPFPVIVPSAEHPTPFRYTNGLQPPSRVIETQSGEISFGIANCWYLDSTFCSRFHSLKERVGVAVLELVGGVVVFVISGAAALMLLLQVFTVLTKQCGRDATCRQRCKASGEAFAAWSPLGNAARLVCLITPVLFWRQIFLPCFACYDFEAAATHEVARTLSSTPSPPHLSPTPSASRHRSLLLPRWGTSSGSATPTSPPSSCLPTAATISAGHRGRM